MSADLLHVAYVEDDADIREVARIALETVGGLEVALFEDGPSFLRDAATLAPQLILLDVMLPSMTGPEILAALRAEPATRAIPVIFMTAKVQGPERQNYLDLGALAVIAKPFDPLELATQLRDHFAEHAAHGG
ncbi:response regulator [Pseudoroseomonas cervicalis]|uniref:response regulator n=1 Tax=Teichococcus cervicalis TaxID=204525 RepID=UPI002784CB40|nr:response regulator [Pseudoroseomonas cervicalis]MDQ1078064.1 two-component system OmpR family response regulator [Pseudoroseomonas cervicalis]